MQEVDEATVRRIARLARLKVTDAEAVNLMGELNAILKWVEQLGEVDTKGVEPMTSTVAMTLKLREDVVTDGEIAADILKNAPMSEDNFFVVPKVVE
jgi:aspartyl-tRNA(Asn)/glutamyl-tRNA(Gln) amidotransferase subunit C